MKNMIGHMLRYDRCNTYINYCDHDHIHKVTKLIYTFRILKILLLLQMLALEAKYVVIVGGEQINFWYIQQFSVPVMLTSLRIVQNTTMNCFAEQSMKAHFLG